VGNILAGSLAGAAHLLKGNAGVLGQTQPEQKSSRDQKGKCLSDLCYKCQREARKRDLSILDAGRCPVRGVRKVTTGITGLWQPSVQSDVAF